MARFTFRNPVPRLALVLGFLILGSTALAQGLPETDPIPPSNLREEGAPGDGPVWLEDDRRVSEGLESQTPPDRYMETLRQLGLEGHRVETSGLPGEKSSSQWSRIGPVGGFGTSPRNGRIAGYTVVEDGASYWIYVGSCQGGLWRVHSSSLFEWEDIGRNLPNPSVRGIAVDPDDLDHVFAGTGDHRRYTGAGMFETTDAGATWTQVNLPFFGSQPRYFYRILHLGDDPVSSLPRLAAVCSWGPIYSDDGGVTWTRGTDGVGGDFDWAWTDLVQHPTNPATLYGVYCDQDVGGQSGVFVSGDYGESWSQLSTTGLPPTEDWDRASLAVAPSAPSTMAVFISTGNFLGGVYKTTNGGTSWSNITNELIDSGAEFSFGGNQTFHAQAISFKPDDANTIFVGAVDLAVSSDGGASWDIGVSENGIEPGHPDLTQFFFIDLVGDDIMWICNDGGIYYHNLNGGITFSALGNSTTGLACSEIDFLEAKGSVVAIGLQDNGCVLSTDAGASWELLIGGDGGDMEIFDPYDGDIFYNVGVYSEDPKWRTFRLFAGGSAESTNTPPKYMPRLFHSPYDDKMWTADGTTLYSTDADGTLNWVPEYSNWIGGTHGLRNFWSSYGRESAFWVNYWEEDGDNDEDLSYVYLGDSGWTQNNFDDFNPTGDAVVTVAPSREWPDEAWVGVLSPAGSAKIFHLRDGGNTVTDITGNLNSVAMVRAIEVMPFNPRTIWVGTDLGVFRTTDGGVTWDPFMNGLPIGRCMELKFVEDVTHTGTHKLLLAMDGRGAYSIDVDMPPIVFVDRRVAISGTGSRWYPFKTLGQAKFQSPAGSIIAIHSDEYQEPQVFSGAYTLVTWGGDSILR